MRDIVWRDETGKKAEPAFVLVEFKDYDGPAFLECHGDKNPMAKFVPVPYCSARVEAGKDYCERIHIPLKLAWAVTIHKSQGMSLDKAVLELGKSDGQTGLSFVAVSRLRKLEGLLFESRFNCRVLGCCFRTQIHLQISDG